MLKQVQHDVIPILKQVQNDSFGISLSSTAPLSGKNEGRQYALHYAITAEVETLVKLK